MGQGKAASWMSGQRVAVVAVCGSAVKEEGCNLYWQKQNSNGDRGLLKSKEV